MNKQKLQCKRPKVSWIECNEQTDRHVDRSAPAPHLSRPCLQNYPHRTNFRTYFFAHTVPPRATKLFGLQDQEYSCLTLFIHLRGQKAQTFHTRIVNAPVVLSSGRHLTRSLDEFYPAISYTRDVFKEPSYCPLVRAFIVVTVIVLPLLSVITTFTGFSHK